jgi:hypothetical protein
MKITTHRWLKASALAVALLGRSRLLTALAAA